MTRPVSVVALGGGHGLHASLSALRRVADRLTAVVTVADDGGSSGRLRQEFGVLPPGDLRMALAALCGDDEWGQTWAQVLQHRFAGDGDMRGHVTGNLLIVSLWEQLGDHVQALDWVGRLLGASGRVLPMALTPLVMTAQIRGVDPGAPDAVTTVRGQVEVATSDGVIQSVALEPADPSPCAEAVDAVRDADWVVLGPGSWFTSVIPHLLVPELRQALVETGGRVLVVLNLEAPGRRDAGLRPGRPPVGPPRARPGPPGAHRARRHPQRPRPRCPRGRRQGGRCATGGRRHRRRRRVGPARPGEARRGVRRVDRGGRLPARVIDVRGRIRDMAMTAQVKAELANTQITKTCCRKAEVATMLRFAGGLHIVAGKIVVEAELDTGAAARRLRKDIAEVYGHHAEFAMVQGNGIRKGSRYLVRVVKDGEALARQTGLLDQRGRPVRGLPPAVVSGGGCDSVAAWRGAFLAHGSLTEPGRSSSLEVTCPGPEAALALVGVARRLGIQAKAREVRGVDRVVIRDGDAIGELLTRLGAHESLMAWEERRMRREVRATANRLANFDDANLRRSARAAVAAGARVERALEILADDVPDHLRLAGDLRLKHKQASLEELGQLHDPVLTKDAIAGRIRRLLAMADKRAEDLGIPDTEASLTPEMLADEA